MQNKPLISIGLITYNQKAYVRDAIEGCFKQTYSPLEIIVSDDYSTDGTDEIIRSMIEDYKRKGGIHHVVFNRNPNNLGIIGNFLKTFDLMHGELLGHAGGDDISYPDRVEKIVTQWLANDKKPVVVYHGADRIDEKGRMLTPHPAPWGYNPNYPPLNYSDIKEVYFFGALMAYSPEVVRKFNRPNIRMGEDFLLGWRALMLGRPLLMKDRLVKYRVGSGLSSAMLRFREARMGTIQRAMEAAGAAMRDLGTASSWIDPADKEAVRLLIANRVAYYEAWRKCLTGRSFSERLDGFKNGGEWLLPFNAPKLIRYMLLLPKWLYAPFMHVFIRMICVRRLIRGRRFKHS